MLTFGSNAYGQLGLGHSRATTTPNTIVHNRWPAGSVRDVQCGPNCTAALLTDGTVMLSGVSSNSFRPVGRLMGKAISSISLSATHLVAISATNKMVHNIPLQAQGGDSTATSTPEPVVSTSSGALFTTCLTDSGKCLSFGMNAFGSLGSGDSNEGTIVHNNFATVESVADGPFKSIACGSGHTLAVTENGAVYAWGRNNFGQLGDGTLKDRNKPVKVTGLDERAIAVSAGDYQSFIISASGKLYAAGSNDQGQLGINLATMNDKDREVATQHVNDVEHPTMCSTFVKVTAFAGEIVYAVAGGGGHGLRHTFAVTSDGFYAWGSNGCGQLGLSVAIATAAYAATSHACTGATMRLPVKVPIDAIDPRDFADCSVRCGWRHTAVWSRKLHWEVLSAATTDANGQPRRATLDDVCADVCMIIAEYVGTGRAAANLAQSSSTWNEYVRFSPAFYRLLKNKYPFRFRIASRQHEHEDPLDVDWREHCIKERFGKYGQIQGYKHGGRSALTTPKPASTAGGIASIFAKIFANPLSAFHKKDHRVVFLGLDAAGKTTILYKLKLGEVVTTIPTIGFNVESIDYKNIKFTCWDVGGPDKIRALWRHYFEGASAIMMVVDSNDRERLDNVDCSVKYELHKTMCEDELKNAKLLVMATKQDLPNAMGIEEIAERLELDKLRGHDWCIQGCCGPSGEGLYEGLEWLSQVL